MDQSKTVKTDISEILKRPNLSSSISEREDIENDQAEEWDNLVKNKYLFNFKKWPVFLLLEEEFILQIKLAMIYDNAALIVSRNNIVYAIGNNMYNRLAIAQKDKSLVNIISPTKVEILCEKNIKKFAIGFYMFALTETGQIYYWDYNEKPVLKDIKEPIEKRIDTPTLLIEWKDKFITDIACSKACLLALTNDGKVYFWAFASYSLSVDCNTSSKPFLAKPGQKYLGKNKIISIACGSTFNMVITDAGKIHGWLHDFHYRSVFGHDEGGKILTPWMISGKNNELLNEVIVKVVCGRNHALALTNEGKLYILNKNKTKSRFCSVLMNIPQINKVLDIASVYHSNRKVVLGDDDRVYVWGDYFNQQIIDPIVTYFSNVHEALMYNITDKYPIVLFMHDLQYINVESDILESLRSLFNDPLTSDIKIKLDKESICVHKDILKCRSEYYEKMFTHGWQESSKSDITKNESYSDIVYKTFLEYLYTGRINHLPLKELQKLLELISYSCEGNKLEKYIIEEIKRKPREIIKQNVVDLSTFAKQHNIEGLIKFCSNLESQND